MNPIFLDKINDGIPVKLKQDLWYGTIRRGLTSSDGLNTSRRIPVIVINRVRAIMNVPQEKWKFLYDNRGIKGEESQ